MDKRQLKHTIADPDLFGKVLIEVVQAINEGITPSVQLTTALEKVRDFFYFGSAYIYEADPQKKFTLQEHSVIFPLNDSFYACHMDDIFTPEQIKHIAEDPWCCANKDMENNAEMKALCDYFGLGSVFVYFLVDEHGSINGCVGMSDMRKHSSFTDEEYIQMKTILELLSQFPRLRSTQRRLEYTMATLENIMDHLGFDIYVNDFYNHDMLYANKSMAAPYGGWDNMKGKLCHEALYDGQSVECSYCPKQHLIDDEGNPTKTYVWDYQRPFDEKWFRVICAAFTWVDGRLAQVISSTDINDAKKNELLIEKMAFSDQLTGMPNRRKLEQDFKDMIDRSNPDSKIAILFLDLDDFKEVNDTYGHNGGDALLKHVAHLFETNSLTSNHSYRYGGDEFIFLFDNVSTENIDELIDNILTIIQTPLEYNGNTIACEGSVGYSFYPDEAGNYWDLLDSADTAMYKRKTARKLAQGKTPR